jgi:serine/threonine protein kinase
MREELFTEVGLSTPGPVNLALICHSLDLHLGNVLLRLPADLDKLSVKEFNDKFGKPNTQPVLRSDGKPIGPGVPHTAAVPMWLGKASEDFHHSEVRVLLTDFGEAYLPSVESRSGTRAPRSVAPPEVRFQPEQPLAFSSDVWTLGCAIWAILGQRPLFEEFLATQDDITAEQIDVLGKPPPEWWEKWGGEV